MGDDHRDLNDIAGIRALIVTPSPDPLAGLPVGSLECAQAEARIALEGFWVWDKAREEVGRALKKLSPEGQRLLAELLTGELQRRAWGSGHEPDAVTPDLIDDAEAENEAEACRGHVAAGRLVGGTERAGHDHRRPESKEDRRAPR